MDDNTVKIVAIVAPVMSTIVLGILAYYTAVANVNAVAAARMADQNARKAHDATELVQQTLAATTSTTTTQLATLAEGQSVIHELVNSRLTEALRQIEALERLLYEATGRVPQGEPPAIEHLP